MVQANTRESEAALKTAFRNGTICSTVGRLIGRKGPAGGEKMVTTAKRLQERNQQIGAILAAARQSQGRSVTECAALLNTSRRRYRAIELGIVGVSAAELELLLTHLQVPAEEIWRELAGQHDQNYVVLRARPGAAVRLVVEVRTDEQAAPS